MSAAVPHGPQRALIIEDDPQEQSLVIEWFRRMPEWCVRHEWPQIGPWETVAVSTLAGALNELQKAHDAAQFFWVIVFDLGLPDASGVQGAVRLMQFEQQLAVPKYCPPIIILTGTKDMALVVELDALSIPPHLYLVKAHTTQTDFYTAVTRAITDHARS